MSRPWDAVRRTIRPEAALTVGLGAALIGLLWWRDELPAPTVEDPPPLLVEVDGASIGAERSDAGPFWTIDADAMTITVTNTRTTVQDVVVSFDLLDGPCGRRGELTVTEVASGDRWRSMIPTAGTLDVRMDPIEVPPMSSVEIRAESDASPCPPIGDDPRSILFQVFDLQASPV